MASSSAATTIPKSTGRVQARLTPAGWWMFEAESSPRDSMNSSESASTGGRLLRNRSARDARLRRIPGRSRCERAAEERESEKGDPGACPDSRAEGGHTRDRGLRAAIIGGTCATFKKMSRHDSPNTADLPGSPERLRRREGSTECAHSPGRRFERAGGHP